jgi:sporulation protein YlmC with PRC-barrel domain
MSRKTAAVIMFSVTAFFFLATQAIASGAGEKTTQFDSSLAKVMVGAGVWNHQGQMLGHVEDVLLGDNGEITYIIVAQNEIQWSDLSAANSDLAWSGDAVRLIPIPYNEVSVRAPERAARELAGGEAYWGSLEPGYQGPSIATNEAYYVHTPGDEAFTGGEVYWGDLPAGSDIRSDVGMQKTYVERRIFVNISEEKLANAPSFKKDEWTKFANSEFKQTVHAYYEEKHPGNEMMEESMPESGGMDGY